MKHSLLKAWRFIVKSSEDPRKVSLTVKAFGLMAVTAYTSQIIPAVTVACQMGYLCQFVDPQFINVMEHLIELAGDIIYYALMLVSVVAMFFGAARKAWYLLTK